MSWQLIGNVAGKDADVSRIAQLELELDLCREEIKALRESSVATVADGLSTMKTFISESTASIAMLKPHEARAIATEVVNEAVSRLPSPRDGKDGSSVTADDIAPFIAQEVQKAVAEIPRPENGKDGESIAPAVVDAMVAAHVTKVLSDLPVPRDGKDGTSITLADVVPLIGEEVTRQFDSLPEPKDGVGLTGALIDRAGRLVLTLSDGTTRELGQVVGKDADVADIERLVGDYVAKIPKPSDGKDGRDGSLENLKIVRESERVIRFCFKDGTPIEGGEIRLHHPVPRGMYDATKAYVTGDVVQYASGAWIATRDTPPMKPGTGAEAVTGWELFVQRGREGKQGPKGDSGDRGPRGEVGPIANRY